MADGTAQTAREVNARAVQAASPGRPMGDQPAPDHDRGTRVPGPYDEVRGTGPPLPVTNAPTVVAFAPWAARPAEAGSMATVFGNRVEVA
jgi:hypothetical protein